MISFLSKLLVFVLIFSTGVFSTLAFADDLKLAVTTSFHNSGLSEVLIPEIKKDLNLDVHMLVVGTGQALKLGRAGDVDAILVHSKAAEEKFIRAGYGTHRTEIMYNDFVLIGPETDRLDIPLSKSITAAFQKIARNEAVFISRGDDSGTNRKELSIWRMAGITSEKLEGDWYRATGSGMGASLNTASAMDGYILADRASWLNFKNKRTLKILFFGDTILFNQYAFIPVNPDRHPHTKIDLAIKLQDWLVSEKGQGLIGRYRLQGEQLFFPNAFEKKVMLPIPEGQS
ncbi:substrate-binding domain-containing protein [Sneathiella aquimaris]|uniref:substrate-binding domain-containing protein n=1 Tax=Sneathiella aquimaris TaxID=2599305 RepID=UPI00146E079C|nr:substrate-binding domain-containing protein [Sneathiella aquimaris]